MANNYKSNIASLITGGAFSIIGWTSFCKNIVLRVLQDTSSASIWDYLISFGFLGGIITAFLIGKDILDGGFWTSFEKKQAKTALVIMLLMISAGWASAKYLGEGVTLVEPTVTAQNEGEFRTTSGVTYTGGIQQSKDITLSVGTQYVVLGASDYSNQTDIIIKTNQTHLSWDEFSNYRGFNTTFSDDGITRAYLRFYDYDAGVHHTLIDSSTNPDKFDLTDLGTTTELNCTWTLADILSWQNAHVFNNENDILVIQLEISGDYDETTSVTINWYWASIYAGDMGYTLTALAWFLAGVAPAWIMMNMSHSSLMFWKQRGRKKTRKSYRRRH